MTSLGSLQVSLFMLEVTRHTVARILLMCSDADPNQHNNFSSTNHILIRFARRLERLVMEAFDVCTPRSRRGRTHRSAQRSSGINSGGEAK